jgi:CRISPR-associated exonuclease Cas4
MTNALFFLALTLFLLAGAGLYYATQLRHASGLPPGELIATDSQSNWLPQQENLYDPTLRLVGKPDYLVRERDGTYTPVELKSMPAPAEPYEGHIMQLAAYCLLVEKTYGRRPRYGILQYKDRAFAINYTHTLEELLIDLIGDMRDDLFALDVPRNHAEWPRCAGCGLRPACDQSLA